MKTIRKIITIMLLGAMLLLAGCSAGLNPDALIKANTQVNQFLEEYPNAEVSLQYYSVNESSQLQEEYEKTCTKAFAQKELFRFYIQDPDSGLDVIGYLDPQTQQVDCIKKGSTNVKTSDNTAEDGIAVEPERILKYETFVEIEEEGIEFSDDVFELFSELFDVVERTEGEVFLSYKLEFEEGELEEKREEGGLITEEVDALWNTFLDLILKEVEDSLEEEGSVEINIERFNVYEEEYFGKVKDWEEELEEDRFEEENEFEVYIFVYEKEGFSEVELSFYGVEDEDFFFEVDSIDITEIKKIIAEDFDLDYEDVVDNTDVEYEWHEGHEEFEGEVFLDLEIEEEDGKLLLEWDEYDEDDFLYYKVMHSKTIEDPKYPEDSAVDVIDDQEITEFFLGDLEKDEEHFFRITVVTIDEHYLHSEVLEFEKHMMFDEDDQDDFEDDEHDEKDDEDEE